MTRARAAVRGGPRLTAIAGARWNGSMKPAPLFIAVLALVTAPRAFAEKAALHPARMVAHPVSVSFAVQFLESTRPEVDLRPKITALKLGIKNQGNRGTCSVYATTFLLEYAYASTGRDPQQTADQKQVVARGLVLSEEYLNWAANQATGQNVDGGYFSDLVAGYETYRIPGSKLMADLDTYDASAPPQPKPALVTKLERTARFAINFLKAWDNTTGYTKAELDAVKSALRAGNPVATGIWWLTDYKTVAVDGVQILDEYPRSAENHSDPTKNPMFDGHSIDLVGFRDAKDFPGGGYFVFRNSFGDGYGDQGYGYVSYQYLLDYGNDAIVVDASQLNPPVAIKPLLPRTR